MAEPALSIRLVESPELARLLRQPGERVKAAGILAAKRAAEQYADDVLDYIRDSKPFDPRTGAVEGSIGWRAEGEGAVVFAGGPTAPHAWYIEAGTQPHIIAPKAYRTQGLLERIRAGIFGPRELPADAPRVLRWYPAGGGVRFAHRVHHPGTDPAPFFFTDLDARRGRLLDAARQALAERLLGE